MLFSKGFEDRPTTAADLYSISFSLGSSLIVLRLSATRPLSLSLSPP